MRSHGTVAEIEWESSSAEHTVTVTGASAHREKYGSDADGNRGVMTTFVEFDGVEIVPALAAEEQPKWDKFEASGKLHKAIEREPSDLNEQG